MGNRTHSFLKIELLNSDSKPIEFAMSRMFPGADLRLINSARFVNKWDTAHVRPENIYYFVQHSSLSWDGDLLNSFSEMFRHSNTLLENPNSLRLSIVEFDEDMITSFYRATFLLKTFEDVDDFILWKEAPEAVVSIGVTLSGKRQEGLISKTVNELGISPVDNVFEFDKLLDSDFGKFIDRIKQLKQILLNNLVITDEETRG